MNEETRKALEILKKKGLDKANKKSERETNAGLITSYVHLDKVGVLLQLGCETDFVARTDEFKEFAKQIAQQILASDPQSNEDLLSSPFFKDESTSIATMLNEQIAKFGENITIVKFCRLSLE
jgi:elongation factor Ts